MKELGRSVVECVVYDVDDLRAELMEIDENLARSELSEAEERAHFLRREEVWLEIKRKESGENFLTFQTTGRGNKQFAAELASVTGIDKSGINKKLKQARELGQDIHRIVGTSLDKGVEMDALLKLPSDQRAELIERAAVGEQVSARPTKEKAKTALEAMAVIEAPAQDRKAMQRQRFWDMWASLDDDVRQELTAVLVAKDA